MDYGSGKPLDSYHADANTLPPASFRERYGEAFLLVAAFELARDLASSTAKTGSFTLPAAAPSPNLPSLLVFPVQKRVTSAFAFIAVGRNEGNDVFIPHASVSRFHAFFRASHGIYSLLDARSANGTMLNDRPVPRQHEGEPVVITPRSVILFGEVKATFLDDAGLRQAVSALR